AELALTCVDRRERHHLLQGRTPRRAGCLPDLATPGVERNRDPRGSRIQRRCQSFGPIELLEGTPIELQPDESPRRPAPLRFPLERTTTDEFRLLAKVDEPAEDAEFEG